MNETQKISVFESYDQWMYVVVRKGYEHPEIVAKYVSAILISPDMQMMLQQER